MGNKKKKSPKKYQLGGIPDLSGFTDLLKGFKGSDQSTWMDQAMTYGNSKGFNINQDTTSQGLTDQGLNMMMRGYETGVPAYMEAYRKANLRGVQEEVVSNASWWDKMFGEKKLTKQADEQTTQQAQSSIGYNGNIGGDVQNQFAGLGSLLGMFNQVQGLIGGSGNTNTFNPTQWFVNPTRGYQFGGDVAQKGYSQGSPYMNMPAIPIPGNTIDMSKTEIPLLLIPDKGEPKVAQPGSGKHKFKGAKQILEIPMMQEGGEIGEELGMTEQQEMEAQPVPIQAEVGEVAAMEDGGIVDVKAKKRHKHMKDEEVTDILPPGSFIASRDKKMQFTKKEAKDIVFGFNPIKYEEDKQSQAPKEHTAADIMTSEKMTPADYLNVVKRLYPMTDRKDDAFAQRADEENLQSRLPYIQSAMYITDVKKPKSAQNKPDIAKYGYLIPRTQMPENPFMGQLGLKDMEFKNGGGVKPKKYVWGAVVAALAALASSAIQAGEAKKQRRRLDGNYNETIGILDKTKGLQTGNLGLGSAAALAGILGQNPNVEAPQLDPRYIEAMPQEVPRYTTDYAAQQINMASQPMINYATRNAPSFTRGLNSLGGMQAQQFSALGNLAMQRAQQNLGLRQNYLQQRGAMANDQIRMDTDALNRTRGNRNTMIQNAGAVGSNYFSGLNAIEANDAGNRITAGNVKATGQNIAGQNYANAMSMIPFAVAQGFNSIDWSKQNNNQSQTYQPNFGQFNFNGQQQPAIIPAIGNTSAGLYANGANGGSNLRWNPATQSWEPR